jgi:hypothetical protein
MWHGGANGGDNLQIWRVAANMVRQQRASDFEGWKKKSAFRAPKTGTVA